MARIRTIKPDLPQSESMGRVSRDARITFVLLWTIADDAGRTRGNSRMLASLLFPYDEDAPGLIDVWLSELEREGCIERYTAQVERGSPNEYIQICNWLSHQRIDKPGPSKIPPPASPRESSENVPGTFANVRESSENVRESSENVRDRSCEEGNGEEGNGRERERTGGEGSRAPEESPVEVETSAGLSKFPGVNRLLAQVVPRIDGLGVEHLPRAVRAWCEYRHRVDGRPPDPEALLRQISEVHQARGEAIVAIIAESIKGEKRRLFPDADLKPGQQIDKRKFKHV